MTMFSSMLRLVEQQNSDGAIRHAEFDPAPSQGPFDPAGREEMIRFIDASTPARHKFDTADGRTGVVYFDTRGRAVSAVLDDLDDDTLGWIAQSRDVNGNALPAGTSVQAEPVEEAEEVRFGGHVNLASKGVSLRKKDDDDYWRVMKDGKEVGGVSPGPKGGFDATKSGEGGYKKGFKTKEAAAAWVGAGSIKEEAETLTPKSRTAIEKFVFSKMPPDSKMKKAGKMQVMFTGSVAKAAGAAPHSPMMIGEMDDQALISVAKLMGYVGVTESADLSGAELAKAHVTVARDAMEPTMKIFSVSFDDMSEDEFKAWLKKNKIYGRVSKSNKGFSAYVESATVESVTFDVIGAPFTKWIASLKKAMGEFDVTSWEALPAGNVRAVINMVVNGKKLTMVVDGTKKYGTNAESATPTNSWITVGSQKIWGGSAIKDALGAVRQALEAEKNEARKPKKPSDLLRDQEVPSAMGHELDRKTLTPVRGKLDLSPGDYGADPIGEPGPNMKFRMVPSGDIVDSHEKDKRMAARKNQQSRVRI